MRKNFLLLIYTQGAAKRKTKRTNFQKPDKSAMTVVGIPTNGINNNGNRRVIKKIETKEKKKKKSKNVRCKMQKDCTESCQQAVRATDYLKRAMYSAKLCTHLNGPPNL